mgnify:CR=1 FL=1
MKREEIQRLIRIAEEQMSHAYAPYSHFQVGAALLTAGGKVYAGCNIENASYGLTNCAERTAIFNAVSDGKRNISAIAIVADTDKPCSPCGACRQVIGEFKIPCIIMANLKGEYKTVTLEELLPFSFSNTDL